MKKILAFFITLSFLGCTDNSQNNDILPFVNINETINLNLPQYTNLLVPGGWTYTSGGISGIILYNINGDQFKAFERSCPHLIPSACSQMTVLNSIKITCPCDDSEFNILNGAPLTSGITNFAREYLVTNLNGSVLRITNF